MLARTPTPVPASAEEAVRQLLRAESEGVVRQDMDLLVELWAEDATVTDAKHTPDVTDDDAVWHGIDAILDRYVVLVFPGNPQFAEPAGIEIVVEGDRATVRSTTQIGDEVSRGAICGPSLAAMDVGAFKPSRTTLSPLPETL